MTKIAQGRTTGVGPGAIPGAPGSTFTVKLTNGSSRALNATQVVVTAVYGNRDRHRAAPVYDEQARDFATVLPVGTSATAVYGFSIPTSSLDSVVLAVDLDAEHVPATFAGSVR